MIPIAVIGTMVAIDANEMPKMVPRSLQDIPPQSSSPCILAAIVPATDAAVNVI